MANLRQAKYTIESVTLICPYCDEIVPAPGGSLYWTMEDITFYSPVCECGKLLNISEKLKTNRVSAE